MRSQESFTVNIIDLSGKLIYSNIIDNKSSQITIEGLSNIPEGFYTCIVYSDTRQYISKVSKIR